MFKTNALFHSLRGTTSADFHFLLTDSSEELVVAEDMNQVGLEALTGTLAVSVKSKYKRDKLRWSCKPLLLLHLLSKGYNRVIYVDNDIYFFASPDQLFEELNDCQVLLTPHWYLSDPQRKQYWLEASLRIGLYNAGFVGVSAGAEPAVQWWAQCCEYNVKKSAWRGLFDDQRYLDLLPILFDQVKVTRNKGCNVASWNVDMCPRSVDENGNLKLDGKWPLVFIHFNGYTMRSTLRGDDPFLKPLLDAYFSVLKEFNSGFTSADITSMGLADYASYLRHLLWNLIRKFKR